MNRSFFYCLILFTINIINAQSWIRINQLGYTEESVKVAVLLSKDNIDIKSFGMYDAITDELIYELPTVKEYGKYGTFKNSFRLDFSNITNEGSYYIKTGNISSPVFRIADDVYNGTADFLLTYMRQQRCGYNPFLKDSCHTQDGFIIYHPDPDLDSSFIDVTGGWHDAADYLQYLTTSANATFQMMFAYQQNPDAFGDYFDENGHPNSNGIPDILDEVKWGLDWLVKMNPEYSVMYNQIADDRDHSGFRLPTHDSVNYGKGFQRPVYYVSGKPQGVFQHKSRSDGVSSTAGKFASAFALGSRLLKNYYPEFSEMIAKKSIEAYQFGKEKPGVQQTAPCRAPYFYEEDNWVDDMQLAAAQLYELTDNKNYLYEAAEFGRKELVTPWMGADTANHYQWYPFVNLGHYFISQNQDEELSDEFISYMKLGIDSVFKRGINNPFLFGVPFIWCSNNLVAAILTQLHLYEKSTGDKSYQEMEASLRDWLFGCNPWGTSMIVGLPEFSVSPKDPHSSYSVLYNYPVYGGLVDGPVYSTIFNILKGLRLTKEDAFKNVQPGIAVYHDDFGDYSTNEPTMDGTASLTYYLSALQIKAGIINQPSVLNFSYGGITRTSTDKKEIHLLFTGHEYIDGYETIISALNKHKIKGGFFFTGDFYRNEKFYPFIKTLKEAGHYLGAHSDKHLLYADWGKRDSTLISKEEFLKDFKDNYAEMRKFGITTKDAPYYMPPYQWYNKEISAWCNELGITIVNFTPGTNSNQDWSYPDLGNRYFSNEAIINKIYEYEETHQDGMNGFLLLTHIGTDERRTEKLYDRLDEIITELKKRGYTFTLFSDIIKKELKQTSVMVR